MSSRTLDFSPSPRPTIGVEWEFALVDKETKDLANKAAELFERVVATGVERGEQIHKELLRNTVEVVTGICDTVGDAVEDLRSTLRTVRPICDDLGVDLFGAGCHPFAQWSTQQLTEGPRYAELIARTQWWGRQMLIWGVHVHVGVNHRDKVLPILTSLLMHYPHMLALSASSPMWGGQDTGYASNRAMMFQQLPTAGLPFHFDTWSEYEGFVSDQLTTGIIDQLNEIRWDIRPAVNLGTIEVRVYDGVSNLDELASLVAFVQCLVVDLDRRIENGEELPTMAPWLVQENKWRAARYGLDAEIIVNSALKERLVTDELNDCLEHLTPIARDLGCEAELGRLAAIPQHGGAYQRQRRVYQQTNDMRAVVAAITDELII